MQWAGAFSTARAWRFAVGPASARTLGLRIHIPLIHCVSRPFHANSSTRSLVRHTACRMRNHKSERISCTRWLFDQDSKVQFGCSEMLRNGVTKLPHSRNIPCTVKRESCWWTFGRCFAGTDNLVLNDLRVRSFRRKTARLQICRTTVLSAAASCCYETAADDH